MQRRRVDFPEPDAPIRQTTLCRSTSSETWSSTRRSPNDFDTIELDEAHVAPARSRRSRVRIRWSVKRASGIVSSTNSTAATVYEVKFAYVCE